MLKTELTKGFCFYCVTPSTHRAQVVNKVNLDSSKKKLFNIGFWDGLFKENFHGKVVKRRRRREVVR